MPGGPELIEVQDRHLPLKGLEAFGQDGEGPVDDLGLVHEHGGVGSPPAGGAEVLLELKQRTVDVGGHKQDLGAAENADVLKVHLKGAAGSGGPGHGLLHGILLSGRKGTQGDVQGDIFCLGAGKALLVESVLKGGQTGFGLLVIAGQDAENLICHDKRKPPSVENRGGRLPRSVKKTCRGQVFSVGPGQLICPGAL